MLGESLLESGVITRAQLDQALAAQRASGALLGDVLLDLNFVTEESLARAMAREAGVPFVSADSLCPDPAAVALVPEQFARRHLLAPVAIRGPALEVVQANPLDVLALDDLRRLVSRPISASCASARDVSGLLERGYKAWGELHATASIDALEARDERVVAKDWTVGELLEFLIRDAVAKDATDLHVEPDQTSVRTRYRVDGVLMAGATIPKELHAQLVCRVKALAGLDTTVQRLPQDGQISQMVDRRRVDVRVATCPTTFGEAVAIHILEREKLVRDLSELGFSRRNLALFRDVLSRSRGLVLVTGPTGAGKTTTLYSALAFLATTERSILTVEDPVEYEIPSIRHTQIRPEAGLTFSTAIRSLLRQDPDVIMISEVADPETAQLALRAALSGIMVFSSLPAQDTSGAMARLMDMGLEPYLLASGVVCVVAQRLMRVVCPACRTPVTYPDDMLTKVGLRPDPDLSFQRGRGCDDCKGTGYRGRTATFEVLVVDSTIQTLIRERADAELIRRTAVAGGMHTLLDDALSKAIFGQTTLEEVVRVACD